MIPPNGLPSCGDFAKALESALGAHETFDPEATTRSLPPVPAKKKSYTGLLALTGVGLVAAALAIFLSRPVTKPAPAVKKTAVKQALIVPVIPGAPKPTVNSTDGQTYVWMPPGTFMMGCSQGEPACDSYPPVEKTIENGFWLGQTEVTQSAWRRVMQTNPSHFKGDRLPVESVSVNEANDYCRTVKGRLPTEVEWEYAARAGSPVAQDAWDRKNSRNSTHPVASRTPNAWGLYDMLGNVWEWTAGLPGSAEIRGGSYSNDPQYEQFYSRRPGVTNQSVGFRCVLASM